MVRTYSSLSFRTHVPLQWFGHTPAQAFLPTSPQKGSDILRLKPSCPRPITMVRTYSSLSLPAHLPSRKIAFEKSLIFCTFRCNKASAM